MDNHLWLWVVLAGLANYTAAHMVSQDGDDGPFDAFKKLRARLPEDRGWVGKGIHCMRCTSFWGALIAAILAVSAWMGFWPSQFLLVWGAAAAVAVFLWRYFG